MDVFVARQPIFDRNKKIYAYELLFRTGLSNKFPDIDGDIATTSLLSSSFFTVGIDKVAAGKIAFINFTEELIAKGTPQLFSSGKMMVEILEDVDPSAEIIASCKELKKAGYELALDDFVYARKFEELLYLSDIIKIDFRFTSEEKIVEMAHSLKKYNCKLLAEKVETYEEFEKAMELGFDYFQGYFFSKPEILKNKDLSASQVTLMRLISKINASEFDVSSLGELISQDISITYKLLTYINSAYFGRLQPISSITQAISYLGEKGFKLFVSLIITSKLAKDKPDALVKMAIVRARFLELVADELKIDSSEMFLLGLFSLIDAMLDRDMEEILKQLSLTKKVYDALTDRTGELFIYIRLIETYETGNWIAFRYAQKRSGVENQKLFDFYLEAIAWADALE
jgi:EAL and modified HD-GYP domain-containing signal transduction protein